MQNQRVNINVIESIKEAWSLIPGTQWVIFKRLCLMMLLVFCSSLSNGILSSLKTLASTSTALLLDLLILAVVIVTAYIGALIWVPNIIIGVHRSIGISIDMSFIKRKCNAVKTEIDKILIIYVIIMSIMVCIFKFLIEQNSLGIIFQYIIANTTFL